MSESSGSIWERIVAWFRGKSGASTGQGGTFGSGTGTGGLGSLKDTASRAASSARDTASQTVDRAKGTVDDMTGKAKGTVDDVAGRMRESASGASDRTGGAIDSARDRASGVSDGARGVFDRAGDRTGGTDTGPVDTDRLEPGQRQDEGRSSGAAASATGRGYDTGTTREASDATVEDMDTSGQSAHGGAAGATAAGAAGMTAEDLDQGGPDTAARDSTGASVSGWSGVASEQNVPAEVGEGVTFSPIPGEHPEADQAATDVGTSGQPFSRRGDDWWDTDRPGVDAGSGLAEQGDGSVSSAQGGGLGPSASAADIGTSTAGASVHGVVTGRTDAGVAGDSGREFETRSAPSDAGGSQPYSADLGSASGTTADTATHDGTSGSGTPVDTISESGGTGAMSGDQNTATAAGDIVAGSGQSGTGVVDTSGVGVDSPATAPRVGYAGSSPATDREGVGSGAPSAATDDGTGASSDDANLVQEAPDDAAVRAADRADAAAGSYAATGQTGDANAGTGLASMPDDRTDHSTAQDIVVGGLIAEDEQATGGDYTDEIYADTETQQTALPAADYADAPTDTASTMQDVTTTLGDQTAASSQAGQTAGGSAPSGGTTGSDAAHGPSDGAPRDAGAGSSTSGVAASTSAAADLNAPTAGTRGVNWVPGDGGTTAPDGFPLKGNASSKIYHPKESSTYDRTIAEYYFATPEDAEAAGYRLPKALQHLGEQAATSASDATTGVKAEAGSATDFASGSTTSSSADVAAADQAQLSSASSDEIFAAGTGEAAPRGDSGFEDRGMTSDAFAPRDGTAQADPGLTDGAGATSAGETGASMTGADVMGSGADVEAVDPNAPTVGAKGVHWLPGDGSNNVPDGFPLKGNASSMIYHPKESSTYDRTIAEYYFATPADAEAAGYRLPKSLQSAGEASSDAARSAVAGATTAASEQSTTETRAGTAADGAAANAAATDSAGTMGHGAPVGSQQESRQVSGRQERPAPKGAIRAQGANCPGDYPIKGNANSRIYHMPTESSYEQTIPEFCFATEGDAKAAGFRARKH